jgi:hypothetical protein
MGDHNIFWPSCLVPEIYIIWPSNLSVWVYMMKVIPETHVLTKLYFYVFIMVLWSTSNSTETIQNQWWEMFLLFLSWLCFYLNRGSIIGIVNRRSPFLQFPDYVDNFFPLCDQLEQEGKWKKEQITTFSRFMGEADGICIMYSVK